MADRLRFVDSVAASPTVRLDLNDDAKWAVRAFNPNLARLRRAMSSNLMRDGLNVSSSSYGDRVLGLDLDLICSSQEAWAAQFQLLARELDRETNWLEYRPTGMTHSVFFKTYRSDVAQLQEVVAARAFRQITVELLADPHGLGVRESISVGTVNNDPAAGSNGCYFDLTGIKGDVAAPMVLVNTYHPGVAATENIILGVRDTGNPANMVHSVQAESGTPGTDTTNPGGAADAAMSGSGTTNYLRCTFATASLTTRVSLPVATTATEKAELRGTYRIFMGFRRSASGTLTARVDPPNGAVGKEVTLQTATATRLLADMGVITFDSDNAYAYPEAGLSVLASRGSGTSNLDFDVFHFVPATSALMMATVTYSTTGAVVIDGETDSIYTIDGTDPYVAANLQVTKSNVFAGRIPMLQPGVTNRFVLLRHTEGTSYTKTLTTPITVYYQPRYGYVRPLAT